METKIIPYFEKKSLAEITATDVIQWQNQLLSRRDENGIFKYYCYNAYYEGKHLHSRTESKHKFICARQVSATEEFQ